MRNPAAYRRGAAAVSLVLAGLLSATFVLLASAPGWGSSELERLEAITSAGGGATVSLLAFALYQLPLAVGIAGVAHLVRGRTPVLSNLAGTLALVGAFGYAVYGGSQLLIPAMVAEPAQLETFAALRSRAEALTGQFAAVGMLGFVLGMLLVSIALWRARSTSRAVPVMIWAFLVVEFVGTSVSPMAVYVSATLLLVVLAWLGVTVGRSPLALWVAGADAESRGVEVASLSEPSAAAPH